MSRLFFACLFAYLACQIVSAPRPSGGELALLAVTFTAAVVFLHHFFVYPPRALRRNRT
ncbi:hypothetical protein [Deinococcus daejeonensis]|uniref:Uncharacterized protein n=1 Tax=Deinococcus daejeonensis TaxID=1007098 RepID=A0ABQ2IWK4_9DEIO|nr:hypothetical protein [Deinococcus daejeonensis]GGN32388.1 hypothetical protein GCM10010842_09030 [Deinococcus daejeonensis]